MIHKEAVWAALFFLGACGEPAESVCLTDENCSKETENNACRLGQCVAPPCSAGTRYVGAGSFVRGCRADQADCESSSQPQHQVLIDHGFCVSITELQVQQYRRCVLAGICPSSVSLRCTLDWATWTENPGANETMPMTCLLWSEADTACRFLGGRLPTEAEWEKAARGGDERRYPWGNVQPLGCGSAVNYDAGGGCPNRPWSAITDGRKGAQLTAASGAVDMAGNVWEWVTDYYSQTAYQACERGCTDPLGPETGNLRSRRGGGFQSSKPQELSTFFRDYHLPQSARSDSQGARCIFF